MIVKRYEVHATVINKDSPLCGRDILLWTGATRKQAERTIREFRKREDANNWSSWRILPIYEDS